MENEDLDHVLRDATERLNQVHREISLNKTSQNENNSESEFFKEQKNKYLKSIETLKHEIKELERQYEKEQTTNVDERDLESIMSYLLTSSDQTYQQNIANEPTKEISSPVVSHNSQLATLASLTGLEFEKVSSHYLEYSPPGESMPKIGRKYDIRGSSHGINFQISFFVADDDHTVGDLKIQIPERVQFEIGQCIEEMERNCSLHAFLKGFVSYAHLNERRRKLFCKTKREFTKNIFLPHGTDCTNILFIQHQSAKGVSLAFVWNILIDFAGKASIELDFIPKLPAAAHNNQELMRLLENLPEYIPKMLQIRTIEDMVFILANMISQKHSTMNTLLN